MAEQPDVYTHGHQPSVLRSHQWRTAENSAGFVLGRLDPTNRMLDVGCGPGTITADFGLRVREVVGIDLSADVVATAREHVSALGLDNVEVRVGNTYELDFEDGSFDVVFAHQVLQHLTRPVDALKEMMRVTKSGGLVAVRDADYSAMFWAPQMEVLDEWRKMYLAVARHNGAEPDAGRWLRSWAQRAGAVAVEVSTGTWTFATDPDRQWWGSLWADRVVDSALAEQGVEYGICSRLDLQRMSDGWHEWIDAPGAFFAVPNVELVIRV